MTSLHPLAVELNNTLEAAAPEVASMLSALGKRMFFPKGILSQSAEAKQKAKRFNATIGIATEGGVPMHLPSLHAMVSGVSPGEAYDYAPPAGRPGLRETWRKKQLAENPSLAGKTFGLPIVTSAITHGISLVADLFVDANDVVIAPDQLWDNYRHELEVHLCARIETYPFYERGGFNAVGLGALMEKAGREHGKLVVLLNFPNNPTGYMPTEAEGAAVVEALRAQAERGTKLVVVCDDAYFGLFYHVGGRSMTESLFGRLTGLHPNILAVKLDGATKELFVWGLRCGFVTFGPGRADTAQKVIDVLDAKCRGNIRAVVSNAPGLSQALVERALAAPSIESERAQKRDLLRARAEEVQRVATDPRYFESWEVYPFNSGYFMLIKVLGVDANKLREHLLDAHQVGLIATSATDLRVAFSCLEVDQVAPLFETVHKAIGELRARG